jgi:hypothetical protein
MLDRRSLFRALAGAAALPIIAKLPVPAKKLVERVGAWATIQIKAGRIIAIHVIDGGSGYSTSETITVENLGSSDIFVSSDNSTYQSYPPAIMD